MARDSAVTAVKRFGLGAKPGEFALIGTDGPDYVRAQLSNPKAAEIGGDLQSAAEALTAFQLYRRDQRAKRKNQAAEAMAADGDGDDDSKPRRDRPPMANLPEIKARMEHGVRTDAPFLERLTAFWANHFCVSSSKDGLVRSVAGAYEREAIRPHILGSFRDMLQASIHHPAMLMYLDNARSVGPNSPNGRRREKGLNENLAREVLELHTVGVDGGYSQEDVTSFAYALTGWTISGPVSRHPGEFRFDKRRHEPGARTVMGKRYADAGQKQAEAILDDLAAHPKTAGHIAGKLARAFTSETPPAGLVDRLEKSFRDSGGDLRAVTEALVSSDEAWNLPPVKLLPPLDLTVAAFRAAQLVPKVGFVNRTLKTFGQPMWGVPSPAGWPDGDMAWASPSAILERIDWADQAAGEMGSKAPEDVVGHAAEILGPSLSDQTREAVRRAESRRQALALMILSPEFQRR